MSRRLVVEADGGSRGNPGPAGYGAVVRDADTGEVLAERAAGIGTASNNVAEYRGLIAGLAAAAELDPAEVAVRMDSKLVVEQMSGRWQVKHPAMRPLAREAAGLVARLPAVTFTWIPRAQNAHADRLANEAMDQAARGQTWAAYPRVTTVPAATVPAATAPATTTVLLRHGQTALSVDRRFSGRGEQPLTELGRAQAAAAAVRLAGSGAVGVVSSPLRRARETAALVGEALGVSVAVEDGLQETDFGAWEGHTFAEVRERWPDELTAWLASTAVAPPDGESFDATTVRVQEALGRVCGAWAGRTVVLVSHVGPIKTLVRLALEAPPIALHRMHLDLASLCEVQWFADGPALVRSVNDTAHVAGAGQP